MLNSNHDAKMFTFSCFLVLLNVLFLLNKQSNSSLLPISSSSLSSIRIEIKQRNWRRIRKYERERGGGSNRPPPCGPSRPYLLPLIFFPRFSPVQFHPHTPLSLYMFVYFLVFLSDWRVHLFFLFVGQVVSPENGDKAWSGRWAEERNLALLVWKWMMIPRLALFKTPTASKSSTCKCAWRFSHLFSMFGST